MDFKTLDPTKVEVVLGSKYLLTERLGSGSFGQIFRVTNKDNEAQVAAKLEKRSANATLVREAKVISDLRGQNGFPSLYDYGKEDEYNYIIVSLLGLNLEKLFKACNHKFSLKTVLMIADQMISRIETLHSKNYLHRDIKPENFCIGRNSTSKSVYMIDYGLAKSYKDSTGKHASFKENKSLVGTARYASLNAHLGYEQSRRDDLEAIGYTLIYFLLGKLPWQNLKVEEKHQKYQKIADLKAKIPVDQLCQGLPSQFATYLNYAKNLEFMEEPDYKYLKKLFRTLFVENGYELDYQYDWYELMKLQNTVESPVRPKVALKLPVHQVDDKSLLMQNSPPLKGGMALSGADDKSNQKHGSPVDNSPMMGSNKLMEVEKRMEGGVDEGVIPVFIPLNNASKVGSITKGISVNHIRKDTGTSPRKRNTLFQDSMARNMSTNSIHSGVMNMSGNLCEDDAIPFEGKTDSPVAGMRDKARRFTVRKEGIVAGGSGLLLKEGDNMYQRNKNKTLTYADARNQKRAPFSNLSMSDAAFLTSRKPVLGKNEKVSNNEDEGNINESSICEWNDSMNLDKMINQKRSFIRHVKH